MSLDPNTPQNQIPQPVQPPFPPSAYPPQVPMGYSPAGMSYGQIAASALDGPVKVLGVCYVIIGSLGLLGALGVLATVPFFVETVRAQNPSMAGFSGAIITVLAVIIGVLAGALPLITGIGLLKHTTWGRTLAIVSGILQLLGFPLGTVLGIFTLYYLMRAGAKEGYEALVMQPKRV